MASQGHIYWTSVSKTNKYSVGQKIFTFLPQVESYHLRKEFKDVRAAKRVLFITFWPLLREANYILFKPKEVIVVDYKCQGMNYPK